MTPGAFINKLQSFNLKEIAEKAIEATRDDMKAAQVEQMLSGGAVDGKPIGKYKDRRYALKKNKLNPAAGLGVIDLRLSGTFQNEIFVDARSGSFVIDSADTKAQYLVKNFGERIYGLNNDFKGPYIQKSLLPQTIKEFKEYLAR